MGTTIVTQMKENIFFAKGCMLNFLGVMKYYSIIVDKKICVFNDNAKS